ncbi:MAG: ABC-type sugar transport system, ATPase component [Haloquadratum sp. J07HQX50]|nr:MAG: ABC-type sugar transport system, ATPase component [Haloquadratum sp. J07HQX50]
MAVTEYQGSDNFVHLRLGDRELTAVVLPTTRPVHGDRVRVSIDPSDVFLFDPSTGQTLRSPGQSEAGTLLHRDSTA